ncbi:hypothetical protein VTL71DRAFT_4706 [Oculimacula yallundae]|uniref:Secreted protein n=1 Tax=Oculimacula yallundae TaxID=86028 RepID=A0ABR4C3D1_9HELO
MRRFGRYQLVLKRLLRITLLMHFCAGTSFMIGLHGVSILSCTFERFQHISCSAGFGSRRFLTSFLHRLVVLIVYGSEPFQDEGVGSHWGFTHGLPSFAKLRLLRLWFYFGFGKKVVIFADEVLNWQDREWLIREGG